MNELISEFINQQVSLKNVTSLKSKTNQTIQIFLANETFVTKGDQQQVGGGGELQSLSVKWPASFKPLLFDWSKRNLALTLPLYT